MSLPIPSAEALDSSHTLQKIIRADIAANGGVISFARYMELALYTPQYGYYSGGATKLGAQGDFTTAPEMSSLFGASIAQILQSFLQQTSKQIMEFGAGSGKLAFDILSECQRSNFPLDRYFIVELSGELKARQEVLLKDFPQVIWLSSMPEAFSGVVLGNEVLDAMPVELVIKSIDGWKKLGVSMN
ncbi:MAG: SAM-dependent methyltransferase, partial [Undibacterium sp.]|nr:SAM-dependent methyltransferase [Undibacterium sp.]